MESSKDSGISFEIFKKQVNDDFFEFIRPLPNENKYVTAPPYLMNYISRTLNFKQNRWLRLTSLDKIEGSAGSAELIVIAPAERSNIEFILDKFELIPNYTKCLFIIPRITANVQEAFDIRGTKVVNHIPKDKSEIYVQEFHYDFYPVEDDFFLLPCYHSFYQINVENDYNDIYSTARALAKIQTVFGEIPHIISIGKNAINTKVLMQGLLKKTGSLSTQFPLIDSIFLFDRACDLVTPLASQVTFEGIIDEQVGVNFGVIQTDDSKYSDIILSEKYDIVSEIRGKFISQVMNPLIEYTKESQKINDKEYIKSISNSYQEYSRFLLRQKHLESQKDKLDQLMFLADKYFRKRIEDPLQKIIMNMEFSSITTDARLLPATAESVIQFSNDWKTAIRLIILQLVINNKAVDNQLLFDTLADQFGKKAIHTVRSLDRLNLLKNDPKISQLWRNSNNTLSLTYPRDKSGNDELLKMCDNNIPLILRIIQFLTSNDKQTQLKLNELGFPINISGQLPPSVPGKPRKILIFFVGGITLSEVNFIRNYSRTISNNRFQFIIGSTDQVNINTFMDQLCPGLFKQNK